VSYFERISDALVSSAAGAERDEVDDDEEEDDDEALDISFIATFLSTLEGKS
jgi:hypothetical protein